MRLLIFHYHDRPGGVREVISRGLPLLLEWLDGVREIVFLTGELTDAAWRADLEQRLGKFGKSGKIPLHWVADPEWAYGGEDFKTLSPASTRRLWEFLKPPVRSGEGGRTVLWAHNLGIGRNIPLLRALPELCLAAGAELWLHHHDWWWDGRWERWRDWRAAGVTSLDEALAATVPVGPHIQHRCVNLADLPFLQNAAGAAARWVGNPLPAFQRPAASEIRAARRWLDVRTGGRPAWLAPVRALRRKNLAEALLLTRRLAPGACLVTTGGSSAAETPGWQQFQAAAARRGWPLAPQVLAESGPDAPTVPALMAAADTIVMTSLQEGFGLPWLEAAVLENPVISRRLPDAVENLGALGCRLSGTYDALPVPDGLFNPAAETARLQLRWARALSFLPDEFQGETGAGPPKHESRGGTVRGAPAPSFSGSVPPDFGQLTLEGQLEVLAGNAADFPLPPGVQAQVPYWPCGSRRDFWAERFLSPDFPEPLSVSAISSASWKSQSAEVRHRFHYWRRHPLLWPGPGGRT
ncbi:MAG: hypothetical protein V4726_12570 [Verrucomicrobiota bacterium]